jgi:hypothetical protein
MRMAVCASRCNASAVRTCPWPLTWIAVTACLSAPTACKEAPPGPRSDQDAAAEGGPASVPSADDLGTKTPAELIELYVFHPNCGFRVFADPAAYHAALTHNRAITAALERRGAAAAGTCTQHLGDLRNIFTGDGGPPENVAGVCHRLLTNLGRPPGRGVPYQFCDR